MNQIRETIGRIKCPFTNDFAEVRRDKKGKLYYVGRAGMIKPNLPSGQEWILDHAEIFGENEKTEINQSQPIMGRRVFVENEKDQEDDGWTLI